MPTQQSAPAIDHTPTTLTQLYQQLTEAAFRSFSPQQVELRAATRVLSATQERLRAARGNLVWVAGAALVVGAIIGAMIVRMLQ